MAVILKAFGAITAAILLIGTLLGSILTLGGFLLTAVKILTIVIFVGLLVMIVLFVFRDRCRRRREASNF